MLRELVGTNKLQTLKDVATTKNLSRCGGANVMAELVSYPQSLIQDQDIQLTSKNNKRANAATSNINLMADTINCRLRICKKKAKKERKDT